jgi:NitT/TauT family transport system substrate-binding protein
MMRHRNLLRSGFMVLLSIAMLVACGAPAAPTTGDASAPTTIRTGYLQNVLYAPLFVGIERGYFADAGLQIELQPVRSGNDLVVQLAAGNFDVSAGGANAGLFNAFSQGVNFTIVAPLHSERPPNASPLVINARRADQITSVADLKGKKVAVNAPGVALEYWLDRALAQGGLTIDDVDVTTLPFGDMPAALENGAIDAALITEPLVTINQQRGVVQVLSNDFIDDFTATYVYMDDALLRDRPETARGFMRAYLRATRDLQGDYMNDEIAGIIEKYTEVPAAATMGIATAYYSPSGQVPIENLETLQRFFLARGELNYDQPLDLAQFVNTDLAREVAAELDGGS